MAAVLFLLSSLCLIKTFLFTAACAASSSQRGDFGQVSQEKLTQKGFILDAFNIQMDYPERLY